MSQARGYPGPCAWHWILELALVFFLVSMVAGDFGFTSIAAGTATNAKSLFVIALVVIAVFLVLGCVAGEVIS